MTFFNFDSWYIYEKAAESSCQLSHSTRISVSLCSKRRVRTNDVKVSFHPLIKLHSTLSLFREWWAAAKHIHLQKGGERVLNVSTSSERADIVDGNESYETHITLCGQQRWVEMKSWGREREGSSQKRKLWRCRRATAVLCCWFLWASLECSFKFSNLLDCAIYFRVSARSLDEFVLSLQWRRESRNSISNFKAMERMWNLQEFS